jgi:hypothetical protein
MEKIHLMKPNEFKRQLQQKKGMERQKAYLTLLKKTQAETTTLVYQKQSWTTKAFANVELPFDELRGVFQKWV